MILKIVDQENITIGGVQVYENNADGKLTVQDTYHISALEYGLYRVKYYEDKAFRKAKKKNINQYIFFSPRKGGDKIGKR